jgi:rfaE bifunctional protein nucleotidyltransferase chain/domain
MRSWEQKIIRDMVAWRKWRDTVIGCTVVLTNGCFDLIHYGHIQLLQGTKLLPGNGVNLVVGVNSDASVRQLKGPSRPLVPEHQRLAVIAALEAVDHCLIFNEKRCDELIRTIRPDIWVKGGDYTLETLDAAERAAAQAVKAQIKLIPYEPGISTTAILARR